MPNEDRDENRNEDNDDDADGGRAASATVVDYNRTVSHRVCCSFHVRFCSAPLIPTSGLAECLPGGPARMSVWSAAGLALALFTCACAAAAAVRPPANYYASTVYGIRRSGHVAYAAASLALAAVFVLSAWWHAIPAAVLLAPTVLAAIFYFTSYLRGFSDEE